MRAPHRKDSGTALLLVIGYLAALTLFATVFVEGLHASLNEVYRAEQVQVCRALAESGVEKAIAELRRNPDNYTGEEATPLGRGLFSVTAARTEARGVYEITGAGRLSLDEKSKVTARVVAQVSVDKNKALSVLTWREKISWR